MNKTLLTVAGLFLGAMALTGLTFISYNNSFVRMDEEIKGMWAQVENQLKRRADLIPNLVETAKGFAGHEKEVFGRIADARSRVVASKDLKSQIESNNELSGALAGLRLIVENYPTLKSDATFTRLMDELAGTENRIAVERGRYNESVKSYNASLRQLPGSLIAGMMGFQSATYFEVSVADKAAPKVSF
ncbi:MAG: LemA family protein [Candidatus Wallbacteria bacterium]|nr:LemA family protein [Candidatus Wallbacteria bacterium]